MTRSACFLIGFGLLAMTVDSAESQEILVESELSYADMADLSLRAPIVATARIDRARRLDEERAVGVAPNHVRFYVEAELEALIRSSSGVPARVSYLVDVPRDADGRRPRIRNQQVILLAAPVPGRHGELQLIAPDAQIEWSQHREQTIRAILSEAASGDIPGTVTGVASAFSVPGTLPGESETQIFLATSDGRPVSLSILRRPNQQPRWGVSLGEIVERASPPPERNTVLWYRLACFLPDSLPDASLENMDSRQISVARDDYRLVREDLGVCARKRS